MQSKQEILGLSRKKIKVDENNELIDLVISEVKRLKSNPQNYVELPTID
jgi:hypothetical protein